MIRIDKLKFIPPQSNGEIWENGRLTTEYRKIKENSVVILKGGLGYGKTVSLINFIKKNHQENLYWYNITDKEIDNIQFCYNIVAMFEVNNSKFKELRYDLLSDLHEEHIDTFVKKLVSILVDLFEEDIVIVLDNFEAIIKNEVIINTLNYFIELLPDNFHLVILTRGEIRFPNLISWRVERKCLIIEEDKFLLNIEQLEEIFLYQYDLLLTQLSQLNNCFQA